MAAQRAKRTTVPTFEAAARTVHKERLEAWAPGKHVDQWINSLRDHVFPKIGDLLVSEVGSADVLSVLHPIWLAKPETARRVRQRIRVVLEWARVAEHRDGLNPADTVGSGLAPQPCTTKHHASVPYSELPKLLHRARASNRTSSW